ncbi:MAG TPA: aminodeoxychorismate synthase component I [Vicinamibacterales bacterium]|nr:aminodeoxychorismate synthase component I [Vicinamibacterales bacterium]
MIKDLVPVPDPESCCEQLAGLPYRLFLDSAARDSRLGRYSFLAADPIAIIRSKAKRTELVEFEPGRVSKIAGDALAPVRTLLAPHTTVPIPGLPPFQGGAAGYLAYDWGRSLERLPEPRDDDLMLPDVVLGIYDWVIAWDHALNRAWLMSTGLPEVVPSARDARAAQRADLVFARLNGAPIARLNGAPSRLRPTTAEELDFVSRRGSAPRHAVTQGWWRSDLQLCSSFSHEGYVDAVNRAREYIFAGDIFQANLSQRFESRLVDSPWAFYRRLRRRNPAPFAAFLDFPEASILSASPERFLRVDSDGHVETRPIKGTRPRGFGPEHDGALGQALRESEKDRAENLMIVDLMRNDLSRVCRPGTIRVPELFALEHYPDVHHLVSTVTGVLDGDHDVADLLRASFPGGSVTGAPKIRAMEIIAELEPTARGVYCGAIGYWSLTGAIDMNIPIRTAVVRDENIYFSAGGAVVADSDPEQEYRETLDKARAIIDALDGACREHSR